MTETGQRAQHRLHGLLDRLALGVDHDVGVLGCLVWVADPVKLAISPAIAFAYRPLTSRRTSSSSEQRT